MMFGESVDEILIVGGGLAGLSAAAALGGAGFRVELLERRPILGGRASSWEVPGTEATIDNCQHLLFWCCTNLMDFYRRLGVADKIRWYGAIPLRTPDGQESLIAASLLPAPLHLAPSMFALHALGLGDKIAIARGLLSMISDLSKRSPEELDAQTMMSWLQARGQTPLAIERFWRAVLTSALNEDLEIVSAWHGLRVFWKGYAASWRAYRIGLPTVSLTELYSHDLPNVTVRPRASVTGIDTADGRVTQIRLANGEVRQAQAYVLAAPFEVLGELRPELKLDLKHSPISGIHLWFDRAIMERPFTALLGRTIQFAFRRHASDEDGEGYVQCVVSASRSLVPMSKGEIVDTAVRELGEFFPAARDAKLLKSVVVKEVRATYSAAAGADRIRPTNESPWSNCWLAGDWTQSGWPATMEGAVRSGYKAAELVAAKLGRVQKFQVPDLPSDGLARWLGVS
jgi:squalene-associated FAD-dependent desaturase